MTQTLFIYSKPIEIDETLNPFPERLQKPQKGPTSPESEIREQMAILLNKSIPFICGRTRGWTKDELVDIYLKASKWKTNPGALLQKLIKQKNEEIKKQLNQLG